jgi:hypothetical protein
VTDLAHVLINLLARHASLRRARLDERDLADRLDAVEHPGLGFLPSGRAHVGDELRHEHDQRNRYQERENDDDDQLFRRLDEGCVLVAHHVFLAAFPRGETTIRRARETERALHQHAASSPSEKPDGRASQRR